MKKKTVVVIALLCVVFASLIFTACQNGEDTPPSGEVVPPSGEVVPPSGEVVPPSGEVVPPSGEVVPPSGEVVPPSGEVVPPSGEVVPPSGEVVPPSGEVASTVFCTNSKGSITGLTEYGKTLDSITIPSSIGKENITNIADNAFANCYNLVSVEIPSTVVSIGAFAFSKCNSLQSIEIPTSVTSISKFALYDCRNLRSITLPFVGATLDGAEDTHFGYIFGASSYEENSSFVPVSLYEVKIVGGSRIEANSFYGCDSLTNVEVSDCVTSIGKGAFQNCNNLQSMTLPFVGASLDGINEIYCFYGYFGIDTHFGYIFGASSNPYGIMNENENYVPTTLTKVKLTNCAIIYSRAFYNCKYLRSIELPSTLEMIHQFAFDGCDKLNKVYIDDMANWCSLYAGLAFSTFLSSSIKQSKYSLYLNNELVTELNGDLLDGVQYIEEYAFSGCSSLKKVILPNSVVEIRADAFGECENLTIIEIPSSVTSIGDNAFMYTNNENKNRNLRIYCEATEKPSGYYNSICYDATSIIWGYTNISDIDTDYDFTIHNGQAYITNYSGSSSQVVVPDTLFGYPVVSIGSAFNEMIDLTSISLPNSITTIGSHAFYGCTNLTYIKLPSGITNIGDNAFEGCSSLQYNEYDNGLYLGNDQNPYLVFIMANDSQITSCEINRNAKIIFHGAFRGCSSLQSLEIPRGVISIGRDFFSDCSSLTSIYIPDSVLSVDTFFFSGDFADLTIYCEAEREPSNWNTSCWYNRCGTVIDMLYKMRAIPIVWGYEF